MVREFDDVQCAQGASAVGGGGPALREPYRTFRLQKPIYRNRRPAASAIPAKVPRMVL